MPQIHSEDDDNFVVQKDDGTVSEPIAKLGAPDLYTALKQPTTGGNGPSIDQTIATGGGAWAPVVPPGPPAPGVVSARPPMGPSSLLKPPSVIGPNSVFAAPGQTDVSTPMANSLPSDFGDGKGMLLSKENVPQPDPVAPTPPTSGMSTGPGLSTIHSSKTGGTSIPKEDQEAMDRTSKAVADTTANLAELQSANTYRMAQETKFQAHQQELDNEKIALNEARRQEDFKARQAKQQELTDKYAKMGVDAGHIWGDEGTGNRIMAAVGIALGAVGSGLNGKENSALKIVENAIQRDIEMQKANIEKEGKAVEAGRSALNDYRQLLGDDRAAELAEMNRGMEVYKKHLDSIAQSNSSEEIKSQAKQEAAKIEQANAIRQAEINRVTWEKVSEQAQPKPGEAPPADFIKEIQGAEQSVNDLGELKEFVQGTKFAGVGPVAARWESMARHLGYGNMDATEAKARVGEYLAQKIKTYSGTGSSAAEMERIAGNMMKVADSPEVFMRLLERELDKSNRMAVQKRQSWESSGYRLPKSMLLPQYAPGGGAEQYGAVKSRK